MMDKEKIREDVERLKLYTMDEHMKSYSECAEAEYNALCEVKEQVKESAETQHVNKTCKESDNSLTQVHASEDLENAAIEICSKVLEGETINIDGYEYVVLSDAEECFKAGATWQKEQMMAKAIDAHCFGFQGDALFSFTLPADNYLVGSKVKVIVIKK